jgi:hypothetical protein
MTSIEMKSEINKILDEMSEDTLLYVFNILKKLQNQSSENIKEILNNEKVLLGKLT